MANPTLILGANNWAIEEDNILGYALGSSSNQYLPREISFTRGSDATYTDSTGVIRQACWNLLQQSETFETGNWSKNATSISSNATTAPNGTLTADALIEDTSNGLHICGQGITLNSSICTVSIYAKANGRNWMLISMVAASNYGTYFDLQNGVLGTVEPNVTATITSVGDGWYRCTLTTTSEVSSARCQVYTATSNGVNSYTGNGVSGLFLWGAQLVQGSEPLAYLRTTDRLNIPRVDSSTGSKAFLLEPQRTNTMLYSEAINSWAVKTELTITDNNAVSPRGTQDASYIQQTTGGNAVNLSSQNISVTTGQVQTVSFYAKAKEVTSITLRLGATALWSGGARPAFTCDLLTGSISVGTGTATVSSQNVGNGWYRFIVTTPATLTSGVSTLQTPTGTVFSSTSGDGFYLWGIQWEQNASYPTTYIPTQASTVTRLADSAVKTGISSLIGQTEGTLFLAGSLQKYNESGFYIAISDGASLGNALYLYQPTSGNLQVLVRKSGNPDGVVTILSASWNVGFNKIAIAYTVTTVDVYLNGVSIGSTTFTALPPFSQFTLGSRPDSVGGLVGTGTYNTSQVYNTRLTNAELATLTTL